MSEEKDSQQSHRKPPLPPYGTFQGVANYPPPQTLSDGLPQPVPPPGLYGAPQPPSHYYGHGYQGVPVHVPAEGVPVRERRLPCCGIGFGWFCFIIGFFLAGIPWYIAVLMLVCSRVDVREKPGYVACTIAAGLATIAIIFGLTRIHS